MTLEDWLENKWLNRCTSSANEIKELFALVDRDLKDAGVEAISLDWRLSMAYNACLQLATISLHACGYKTQGEAHHEKIVNSLKFSIEAPPELIRELNFIRTKRNRSSYDLAGTTSELEVKETIKFAQELRSLVKKWLRKNHPDLIEWDIQE